MSKRNPTIALAVLLVVSVLGGCAGSLDSRARDGYARAPAGPDANYFYDALAPYGEWIRTDRYGLVWSPYGKQVDWRPYTDGEWVWTDYGWAWAADEDWGWATYHYGRWYDDPYDGWCWLPGRQWAPAWVAWRAGDGWVGWAPLPPELAWGNGGWLGDNDWDHLPGVGHHWWSFCREGELPGPGIGRRLAPRHRAVVLIDRTRNITSYSYVNERFANRSLDVAPIRRASGQDIATRRIADLPAPVVRTPRVAPQSQALEAAELRRRAAADREQMERDQAQAQELRQRAVAAEAERLRRQQESERKALEDQTERDERVLRSRQVNNPRTERPTPERTERPVKRDGQDAK
jgi:hypothetical protein